MRLVEEILLELRIKQQEYFDALYDVVLKFFVYFLLKYLLDLN